MCEISLNICIPAASHHLLPNQICDDVMSGIYTFAEEVNPRDWMTVINRLDYMAAAKVFAVFGAISGLITAVISLAGGSAVGAIIAIISSVVVGFIGGLIFAVLYNLVVSRFVKLEA
jgi:hypothetical protein